MAYNLSIPNNGLQLKHRTYENARVAHFWGGLHTRFEAIQHIFFVNPKAFTWRTPRVFWTGGLDAHKNHSKQVAKRYDGTTCCEDAMGDGLRARYDVYCQIAQVFANYSIIITRSDMTPFHTFLAPYSLEAIPERYRAEFWQEITVVNMRRIRTMLFFAVAACTALIYGMNIRNVLHLSEADNRIVLAMHLVLLVLILTLTVLVVMRPVRSPEDLTNYHRYLMNIFGGAIILAPQALIYAIIVTKGHPIFFFAAVVIWYSSLLVPPRTSVFILTPLLFGLLTQLAIFSPPLAEESQFPIEALIFSVAVTIALIISSAFLFRSTVEGFLQRKAVEEERNRVAGLNAELGAAYVETDTMNQELTQRQEILEEQAMEIEIINTKLHEQNEVLLALNEEKNEILGIVSHDLKNPISAVRGLAEILEKELLAPEQTNEIIRHIADNADRMLALVKNLLDVNQLESGARQFQRVEFDVEPLVGKIVKEYQIAAKAKNIRLEYFAETAPNLVCADEQAVRQVLDNLVSNALKYSPHGKSVVVCIRGHSPLAIGHSSGDSDSTNVPMTNVPMTNVPMTNVPMPSDHFLRIEVRDEGPGISPQDRKKLFGKFARLSARPTGGEHSTGLGLSIVKTMVEAMNGKVWCESELGKGATFIVELPTR
jgi:signal transduction histidine kinase